MEVVGRIREHPDGRDEPSAIQVLPNGRDLRIRQADHLQYRDFSLDGVSRAEDESLEAFYKKYAEARVDDVKGGGKCTIMMYGPTGAGKSHTMFGSQRERGVAYHALRQIMGMEPGESSSSREVTVRASVWEIFNEEIFDLLAQTTNPPGSMKGASNRVGVLTIHSQSFLHRWMSICTISFCSGKLSLPPTGYSNTSITTPRVVNAL